MRAIDTWVRLLSSLPLVVVLLVQVGPAIHPATATGPRVDLRVLVVTDGAPEVEALRRTLVATGVPTTAIDLRDPARPVVDEPYLSDAVDGAPRARFQGVVLPDEYPSALPWPELDAIREFERRFHIRQINASAKAARAIGLADPSTSGYVGSFDGRDARLTTRALAGDFAYARGPVPFGDENPGEVDNWVEISAPLPGFTPLVTATMPGSGRTGALAGVFEQGGREELSLTFSYTASSLQFQILAPGLVRWLTRGVHLGIERSYFAMHIDDVLLPNARWDPERNCAAGSDCPTPVGARPVIRMTADDVAFAVDWQRRNGFRLDLAFNGAGSVAAARGDTDPLFEALLAAKDEFGWINHTWSHLYLGCVRDQFMIPWTCSQVPLLGWTRYVGKGRIEIEIEKNIEFAQLHGLPIDPTELVTGEHGGLRSLPQMPDDNPRLSGAVTDTGIRTLAADASDEQAQRNVGSALTVPRHPVDLEFSAATNAEAVDYYNWVNTSQADGGSGACESDGSCVDPADPDTGFVDTVVRYEGDRALPHLFANDPRPHYLHQSQMTEDRTLYPLLDRVLGRYRSLVTESRPLLVPTMTQARDVLAQQAEWTRAWTDGQVEAWIQDGTVTMRTTAPLAVPLTVPPGSHLDADGPEFGEPYGGARSAWTRVEESKRLTTGGQGDRQ
ncbi:MAG: hypothetical protein AB7J32_26345 [Pseudonocardia sp.]